VGDPHAEEAEMGDGRPTVVLRDNRGDEMYEAEVDGEVIGILGYRDAPGRRVLVNTSVDPEYRHRGIAHRLIGFALDDIRAHHLTLTVLCPIVGDFIREHPEYADLVDAPHPGRAQRPQ
jgi:predicted GNAT family acetyltransferase